VGAFSDRGVDMKKNLLAVIAAVLGILGGAHASDVGHYNGGVFSIRDYFIPPEPGVYGGLYNYGYRTERVNDNSGNKITTGPLGLTTFDLDVKQYALAPMVLWVAPWQILGAKYGCYVAPEFANVSLDASVSTALGRGGRVSESSFGVGDLFVQPLWLDWSLNHWDWMLAYGFYAPIGRYDTAAVGPFTLESPSNIGLGYWTQQIQGGVAWYPWTNRATAVTAILTYEYNNIQQDTGVRYGQILTFNWGISQYLPLNKHQTLLLELGPAGYDAFQISNNTGQAFANPSDRSQVQSVGGQIGVTYVPWSLVVNFHGFYEYYAANRVQGSSIGVNVVWRF
jgi:hypothetical protein